MRIELFFYKDISLLPPKHITQPDIRTIEFQAEFLSFHESDIDSSYICQYSRRGKGQLHNMGISRFSDWIFMALSPVP